VLTIFGYNNSQLCVCEGNEVTEIAWIVCIVFLVIQIGIVANLSYSCDMKEQTKLIQRENLTNNNRFLLKFFYTVIEIIARYLNVSIAFQVLFARLLCLQKKTDTDCLIDKRIQFVSWWMIFAWLFVIVLLYKQPNEKVWQILAIYLIAITVFNVFFYYALRGGKSAGKERYLDHRFFVILLSFALTQFLFAYLYLYWDTQFRVLGDASQYIPYIQSRFDALYLSVGTAFTLTLDAPDRVLTVGRIIVMAQLFNSFVFLSVVMAGFVSALPDEGKK
jgi:hypothetical protein